MLQRRSLFHGRRLDALVSKKAKVRKTPPTKYPRNAERTYKKFLRQYSAYCAKVMRQVIKENEDLLLIQGQSTLPSNIRADALPGDIDRLMAQIMFEVSREYTDAELLSIAGRMGLSVEEVVTQSIENQWQTVLDVNLVTNNEGLLRYLQQRAIDNVDLIKSIPTKRLEILKSGIIKAVTSGRRAEDISSTIDGLLDTSDDAMENSADLIARDQIGKLTGQINQYRQTENGVDKYEWSTSMDERVRPEHEEREGKIFSWNDPPEDGHPGEAINCRCVAIPVFDE